MPDATSYEQDADAAGGLIPDTGWILNPDGSTTDQYGNIVVPAPDNSDLGDTTPYVPGNGTIDHTAVGTADPSGLGSILDKIKSFTGLTGAQLAGLGLGGLTLASSLNQAPYNPKTPAQLLAMQPSNTPAAFTQAQMAQFSAPMKTGNQLERQYAADMKSPVTVGVGINRDGSALKFAEGGDVPGALSQVFDSSQMQGLVSGEGGGQDDMVDARLSPGEYVFDAETVAMLGDGDNAAGARKLDELREQLRAHKRSAPDNEIAPPAEGPLSYLGASNNG